MHYSDGKKYQFGEYYFYIFDCDIRFFSSKGHLIKEINTYPIPATILLSGICEEVGIFIRSMKTNPII